MLYKVFLVEDEIVTREGIRENVDWRSAGLELCGEAPDGEIALPLIEAAHPDVLITDIKMPFMDGLELCKIVRERLPWIKIIILSGYDEFNFAQASVKMGVTEYLLKPVSALDLWNVLKRVTDSLDLERREQENLKQLRDQLEDNRSLLRERFLLRLVMGGESSAAAIEQSHQLGLDILAKCYLVVLLKVELKESARLFDYHEYQRVDQLVSSLIRLNPDTILTKKDFEELVIIFRGAEPAQLEREGALLAERIKQEVEERTTCNLKIGIGSPQERLGEIHRSFAEALARIKGSEEGIIPTGPGGGYDLTVLQKLDESALDQYLKCGAADGIDDFFDAYIKPIGETDLHFYLVRNFVFVDIVLTTAQFVSDLGGSVDQIIPEIHQIERLLAKVKTIDQVREETRRIFTNALVYRDSQVHHERAMIVQKAKIYMESHSADPNLSLNEVAAQANLSPSYFSAVFSRETGESFREFLTRIRIERAKALLRTTNLKCAEVAYLSGYNDQHYFSHIFRKNTGLTPQQFRFQPQKKAVGKEK